MNPSPRDSSLEDVFGRLEDDDAGDSLVGVREDVVEHLRLFHGAREAVHDEPSVAILPCDPVSDQAGDDVVGDEPVVLHHLPAH